jgi:hypothetical protein
MGLNSRRFEPWDKTIPFPPRVRFHKRQKAKVLVSPTQDRVLHAQTTLAAPKQPMKHQAKRVCSSSMEAAKGAKIPPEPL